MPKKLLLTMLAIPAMVGGLLFSAPAALADGELMVLPVSTRLFNAHPQMIKVRNVGDSPLYLSVRLEKVMNPGMYPEKKIMMRDLPHPGVLATPEKLTLGPNQSRDIRLTSLEEPAQESVYRLYITPVHSLQVKDAPQDKITAPMSVAIGYGVLVRHMPVPRNQKSSWTHRCEGKQIILTNSGNIRVRLSDMKFTPANKKNPATVGLFPGVPQSFTASQIVMNVNDEPTTVTCP